MTNSSFDAISQALTDKQTILVASHLRPDADALGSTIAFALWLKSLGKTVTAWNEDGMLEKFRYLPHADFVTAPGTQKQTFDAVVAVDTSVQNRLGTVLAAVESAKIWINIDHHVSNERFADLNYVDSSAAATGQILFEFFESQKATITKEIAANLYAAISTDTGSFQYPATSVRTFQIAAQLLEAGVEIGPLSQAMYESQPRRRVALLQHALNSAHYTCDGRVVSFSLTLADVRRLGVLPEDNEGIIDHLRSIDEVVAAVFFEELEEGRVRVSARSKDPRVDVCEVCKKYGGGGHLLAAGARVRGTITEVQESFLKVVCDEIRNCN